MLARHRQTQILDLGCLALARTDHDIEQARSTIHAVIDKTHISLRVLAISHNAAVFDAAHQSLHFGMIKAHHAKAIEGNILDKLRESRTHSVEIAVMIEMFRVDIGDDRNIGRKLEERTVAFIRFHHHPVTIAHAGIGAIGVDDTAIDNRWIEVPGIEQGRNH